jgi:RNA polymerase sigma factor FliA
VPRHAAISYEQDELVLLEQGAWASSSQDAQPESSRNNQELRWWHQWRTIKDATARAHLLALHLPHAERLGMMIHAGQGAQDELDDALQFARCGMLEAFERFDPSLGTSFRHFAQYRVCGAVVDGLARFSEHRAATHSLGTSEAASALGRKFAQYFREIGIGAALDFVLGGTAMTFPTEADFDPLEGLCLAVDSNVARLSRLVSRLRGHERRVLERHYFQHHSLQAIAQELGLTKGRVSQVHKKAIESLQREFDLGGHLSTPRRNLSAADRLAHRLLKGRP